MGEVFPPENIISFSNQGRSDFIKFILNAACGANGESN